MMYLGSKQGEKGKQHIERTGDGTLRQTGPRDHSERIMGVIGKGREAMERLLVFYSELPP